MKSLPSYDEALKRASETNTIKKIVIQQKPLSTGQVVPTHKSADINSTQF